jgi:hypothetical protein
LEFVLDETQLTNF